MLPDSDPPQGAKWQNTFIIIKSLLFFLSGQLAGGVILGVALWLRHDNQTSSLLLLQFEGQQAPGTFYISE